MRDFDGFLTGFIQDEVISDVYGCFGAYLGLFENICVCSLCIG